MPCFMSKLSIEWNPSIFPLSFSGFTNDVISDEVPRKTVLQRAVTYVMYAIYIYILNKTNHNLILHFPSYNFQVVLLGFFFLNNDIFLRNFLHNDSSIVVAYLHDCILFFLNIHMSKISIYEESYSHFFSCFASSKLVWWWVKNNCRK